MVRPPVAKRLRRGFANTKYPLAVLRFEDGHEIRFKKGESKSFYAFLGEKIKLLAVWDVGDRELIAVMRAEQFDEAK